MKHFRSFTVWWFQGRMLYWQAKPNNLKLWFRTFSEIQHQEIAPPLR
jgi:hypothetical protein